MWSRQGAVWKGGTANCKDILTSIKDNNNIASDVFLRRAASLIFLFCFQLSELEQRVLEAEGRAEEAEDKVSRSVRSGKRVWDGCRGQDRTCTVWSECRNKMS